MRRFSLSRLYNVIYERAALDARARLHILLMWKRRAPGEKMSIVAHTARQPKEKKKDGATASFFIVISISCTCSRAREWCPFFREPIMRVERKERAPRKKHICIHPGRAQHCTKNCLAERWWDGKSAHLKNLFAPNQYFQTSWSYSLKKIF